jgi:hypothetical protein
VHAYVQGCGALKQTIDGHCGPWAGFAGGGPYLLPPPSLSSSLLGGLCRFTLAAVWRRQAQPGACSVAFCRVQAPCFKAGWGASAGGAGLQVPVLRAGGVHRQAVWDSQSQCCRQYGTHSPSAAGRMGLTVPVLQAVWDPQSHTMQAGGCISMPCHGQLGGAAAPRREQLPRSSVPVACGCWGMAVGLNVHFRECGQHGTYFWPDFQKCHTRTAVNTCWRGVWFQEIRPEKDIQVGGR